MRCEQEKPVAIKMNVTLVYTIRCHLSLLGLPLSWCCWGVTMPGVTMGLTPDNGLGSWLVTRAPSCPRGHHWSPAASDGSECGRRRDESQPVTQRHQTRHHLNDSENKSVVKYLLFKSDFLLKAVNKERGPFWFLVFPLFGIPTVYFFF